jgi:hypothetical protein
LLWWAACGVFWSLPVLTLWSHFHLNWK